MKFPRQVKKFYDIHRKYRLISAGEQSTASGRVGIKVELIGNSKASNKSTLEQEFSRVFHAF